MKKQRILSALLALCLVFSLVPTALAVSADDFTDVGRDSWCYEYVDYVTSKGYFLGTSDTTFSPDRNMTRAMFVVVLSRFDGAKVDNSQSAFTDVEPGSWCAGAINWAAANKIVEGKGDGKFAPNDPITRAQMCAIIQRYLNYYTDKHNVTVAEKGSASALTDRAQIPAYAVSAVKQCQIWGLINGYSDGTFRPQALSTRAHVAAVVYRLARLVDGAKPVKKGGSSGGPSGPSGPSEPTYYTYTLTYDANGGTGAPAPQTKANTTATSWTFTVSGTVPTREGYTFLGWAGTAAAAAPEAQYAAGRTVTLTTSNRSLTLYAVWKQNAPEADPDDLVGNAVLASVDQVNDKYDSLKRAVVEAVEDVNAQHGYLTDSQLQQVKDAINSVVSVSHVTANFTSGDTAIDPREVKVEASVSVNEGQVVSVIEKATQFASDLIDGVYSRPSAEDVEGFLSSVKNAVEEQSGIVLTDKTLGEIKTQVLDKVKGEGKALWANFHDGNGTYVCGDIDITMDGVTYATLKVGQNGNTTLEGDKTEIAKNLGTAIAKKMYQGIKTQSAGAYISDPNFTAGVQLIFAPSADAETAAKTEPFPSSYDVVLDLQLDSNGLVEYKYDAGNYLRLNITKSIQDAYNDAVNEVAASITWNDQTEEQVVNKVKEILTDQVDTIVTEVQGQLDSYGITLTHTTAASLKDALLPKVEGWVETNWTRIVASLDGSGLRDLNNDALIDAVLPLIEQDIDDVDMDAMLQEQIESQLAENGIDESWIVDKANSSSALESARAQLAMFDVVTFDPAEFSLEVTSVEDVNALMSYDIIAFTGIKYVEMGGSTMPVTMTGTIEGPEGSTFGDSIRNYIVETAEAQLSTAMEGSAALSALLEQNPDVADYLLYSALVQMGLEFADEKAEAANNGETLTALKATVKTVAKEKMEEKLNQKLAAIDVTEYLEEGELAEADYQAKIDLLNSLKFPNIQTKTAAGLASALTSATMTEIVGDKGNSYVEQYLGKVINKAMNVLPAGASVTIGGVTLDKNTLAGLGEADTTMEAIQALADILAQFGDLSINSFAPEAGQVMTVAYNGRTASVHLVIGIEA